MHAGRGWPTASDLFCILSLTKGKIRTFGKQHLMSSYRFAVGAISTNL
jgi:hypothetical protein